MNRPIYYLEYPSWCPEITIFGYRFTRVDNYQKQVQRLQHLISCSAEYQINANTGGHAITASIEIPEVEEKAVLEWTGGNISPLSDILLLLSLFTRREVFVGELQDKQYTGIFLADPRVYTWGGYIEGFYSLPATIH